MAEKNPIWGIHMDAGVGTGPAEKNYIGIRWAELGDLSRLPASREAFKAALEEAYPDAKQGAIPVNAGVLYRFVHEIQEGHVIVYPSKVDRMVNIGKISGGYRYNTELDPQHPNIRPVSWVVQVPRETFSQAALYEIGSFITLFVIRKHADEFLAILEKRPVYSQDDNLDESADDDTVTKSVSAQAEETANDFVIRQLKTGIDPYQFERFVAHLLECMGYHARVTARSGDGGVDVIAHKDQLGFEPPVIKVQCKQITTPIGRPEVTQLLGNVENSEHGLFITLGSYTRDAREYDRSKANLRLIDGEQLVELIFANYQRFDPRYQALLPLKRIYVPSLKTEAL